MTAYERVNAVMKSSSPIPLTLVGGFLGSGKTTLINRLLADGNSGRLAVLVNDFGAVNIDAGLIVSHDGRTIALSNGCICCSIGDGLTSALLELRRDPHPPDHVVIEASGVADPWKVAQIGLAGSAFSLAGIVTVADAAEIQRQAEDAYVGDMVGRQLRCADILVLNKCDLAPPANRPALRQWLAHAAPCAEVVETRFASLGHDVILGPATGVPADAGRAHAEGGDEATQGQVLAYEHPPGFARWTIEPDAAIERTALEAILNAVPDGILRVKGVVTFDDGARHVLQLAGRRWCLSPLPERSGAQPADAIVIIGRDEAEDRAEAWITKLQDACSENSTASTPKRELKHQDGKAL